MNWMWLNIPLMALFFLAVAGIPLWLVLRRPDFSAAAAGRPAALAEPVAASYAAAQVGASPHPATSAGRRELVGAGHCG